MEVTKAPSLSLSMNDVIFSAINGPTYDMSTRLFEVCCGYRVSVGHVAPRCAPRRTTSCFRVHKHRCHPMTSTNRQTDEHSAPGSL